MWEGLLLIKLCLANTDRVYGYAYTEIQLATVVSLNMPMQIQNLPNCSSEGNYPKVSRQRIALMSTVK